jgi:uncharacterized protein YjlB
MSLYDVMTIRNHNFIFQSNHIRDPFQKAGTTNSLATKLYEYHLFHSNNLFQSAHKT